MVSLQRILAGFLLFLCSFASAQEMAPGPAALPAEINSVLLITVDTLRADILGFYSGAREPMPVVAGWAKEGVIFDQAYATSSWTVPSLASLLTSLYPSSHGAIHGIRRRRVIQGQESLPEAATTLAEAFREHGFTTFAVTSNPHLSPAFGFQRGFQRYANLNRENASEVRRKLQNWRHDLQRAEKVFLWLHFFDPHLPYQLRPPRLAKLHPGLAGPRLEETLGILQELRHTLGVAPAPQEPAARFGEFRAETRALYESEVSFVNDQIQVFLQEHPRFSQGLICFTADHGEEFLEHGFLGHGFNLYQETVRVPLVLRHPRLEAKVRISKPLSLVDLAPTLLTLAGGNPPESWAGRSAFSKNGERLEATSPIFAEVSRFELKKPQASFLEGSLKLIVTGDDPRGPGNPIASPTRLELYDLAADPHEKKDLSHSLPEETKRLYRLLLRHQSASPKLGENPKKLVLSSETLRALKALGYLH